MASEIADAALAARLDRIKELTSELARMQADSVEARLLAERIQREIDQRTNGGAADWFAGRPLHCCRKTTDVGDFIPILGRRVPLKIAVDIARQVVKHVR